MTLLDREGPAAGASYGNAGVLASGSIVPVTVPGLLGKAPRMLFSRSEPLFLKWGYLPKLLGFLPRYLKHGTKDQVERLSKGLHTLLHDCPDEHHALARETGADAFIKDGSYIFAYKDKAAFDKDAFAWDIRSKRGTQFREMDAKDLSAFDPNLEGRFGYGVECLHHGQITDPGAYINALFAHFEANGGDLEIGTLRDFHLEYGKSLSAITDKGTLKAENFVLATGAWSKDIAQRLGIRVPLEAERGYHIEFYNPSITFRAPTMIASGKFVASSMEGRLRCAGVIEFGGLGNDPSKAPLNLLKTQIKALFPELTYDRVEEWMGHRPATADSLPVIGVAPRASNVFVGYGHQHIGLSGGPKTGRWLSQMIMGEKINTDLSAYAPDRRV